MIAKTRINTFIAVISFLTSFMIILSLMSFIDYTTDNTLENPKSAFIVWYVPYRYVVLPVFARGSLLTSYLRVLAGLFALIGFVVTVVLPVVIAICLMFVGLWAASRASDEYNYKRQQLRKKLQ